MTEFWTFINRRAVTVAALICIGWLTPVAAPADDRISTRELEAITSELRKNAEECRTEIMPLVASIDDDLRALDALVKRFETEKLLSPPFGGKLVTVAGIVVRYMPAAEYRAYLDTLEVFGLVKQKKTLYDAAFASSMRVALQIAARKKELERQKESLTTHCRETEAMLARATELLKALKQSASTSTGTARPGRTPEIIVNYTAKTDHQCEISANSAHCVVVTGNDRCSYRAWWEFPSMGELVPGKTFELEVRGAYACNYDAGPAPKRGPNWGTNVGYDYRGGLVGFGWHKPGESGLPGWVGATGCVMYFGAHGSGSTRREVKKTCTFWVPQTFPNRRVNKSDPNEPDYRIQAYFEPSWWAAQWVIR